MKFTLAQHKQHLTNMRAHYERERARVESEAQRLVRIEADCISLETQIAEAQRRGMEGFDRERFMRTRARV